VKREERGLSDRRAARLAHQNWNRAADVWEDFVEHRKDYGRLLVHGPALLRAVGNVRGLDVLDIGCGQGYFTRKLADRGARVTGIDWSAGMLTRARAVADHGPGGIVYRLLDARQLGSKLAPGSFDRAVACMSLMDAPGLDQILRGVHRVLRADGRFDFSVVHPFNSSRVSVWQKQRGGAHGPRIVDGYFDEGVHAVHWKMARLKRPFWVPHWHFTLATWFKKLHHAGFQVVNLIEPVPTSRQVRAHPELEGAGRVPFWLVVSARKV
jgi:2-polyprenyl-3-methyl-5-hydroxy-6-metoxy-1,4-benzoquinol methylase